FRRVAGPLRAALPLVAGPGPGRRGAVDEEIAALVRGRPALPRLLAHLRRLRLADVAHPDLVLDHLRPLLLRRVVRPLDRPAHPYRHLYALRLGLTQLAAS